MEDVIAGKFKLGRKIGSGSFGELYLGVNVHSGDEVAVKLEGNKAGLLRFLLKPSLPSLSHRPTTQTVSPPSYPPLATVSLSFSSNNLTGKRNSWKIVLSWQSLGFESKPKLASDLMESEKGFSELKWNLYPDIEPDSSGFLKVSDIHTIYWGQSGNPDGRVFYGSFEEEQEKGRTSTRRSSQRVLR